MYFSSNLSHLRRKQNLTQDAIAGEIGLSRQSIAFYESGDREPTLCNLVLISKIFSVSLDDLLTKDLRPAGSILSSNIKYLRQFAGYAQNDMCKLLKLSQPTLANYESGIRTPSVEGLINLSEFFGISVDDLLKKDLLKGGYDG